MSFDLTKKVLQARLPLKPNEKLVLAMFATYADKYGFTFPAIETLLDLSGIGSDETITNIVKNLIAKNLLVPTNKKKGTTKRVREFQINIHRIETMHSPVRRLSKKKINTPKSGGIKATLGEINTPKSGDLNTPEIGGLNTPKNGEPNKPYNKPYNKPPTATPFLEKDSKAKGELLLFSEWTETIAGNPLKDDDPIFKELEIYGYTYDDVSDQWKKFTWSMRYSDKRNHDWLPVFRELALKHAIENPLNIQTKVNPESLGESI